MSPLDALVRSAAVRIAAPGEGYDGASDAFWGTGFFIAPTWVLTCAHVLAEGGGEVWGTTDAVGVTWAGGRTTGTVRLAHPVPRHGEVFRGWPAPDLALVHVPEALDVACVWLSDRSSFEGSRISLHGWSLTTGTRAYRPAVGQVSGLDGPLLLLRGERPVAGTSGGPLVDRVRGEVIGVCKARDEGDPTAGVAVPVTALHALRELPGGDALLTQVLAAHDAHHLARQRTLGSDSSWTDAQLELLGDRLRRFDPALRAHLLGRLAALTPPATSGEVASLVDGVRRRTLQGRYRPSVDEPAPRTWREGVGLLYGRDEARELMGVVLYAAEVASLVRARGHEDDVGPLRELGAWVRTAAEPLIDIRQEVQEILDGDGPGTVKRPRPRAAVRVVIHPCGYGDRYPWEVKLVFDPQGGDDAGGVRGFDGDDTGHRRRELRTALRAPLAAALNQCDVGGQLAAVEFVVPRDLFDTPFDTWELAPRRTPEGTNPHGLPLGQRRVVAVRDLLRTTVEPTPEWQRRWTAAQDGPLAAVPLRAGVPGDGHDAGPRGESWLAAYDRLSNADPASVPIFCGGVGQGDGAQALDAALAAGHPVVIWRSQATGHTDCADFHRQAEEFVAEVRTAERLHGPLRSLRIRTGDPDRLEPETAWGRSIALLFDPPDPRTGGTGPVHEPYPTPEVPW
ncbi:VMAP-C domain-containing protein [Streptomyces sp. GSL17-111]|uniref:VMAP-C domain-containing protein n=1 Tax=Streptomyces sp. GSL17-111 TaxID=3121596 RepID=UPI0030F41B36